MPTAKIILTETLADGRTRTFVYVDLTDDAAKLAAGAANVTPVHDSQLVQRRAE